MLPSPSCALFRVFLKHPPPSELTVRTYALRDSAGSAENQEPVGMVVQELHHALARRGIRSRGHVWAMYTSPSTRLQNQVAALDASRTTAVRTCVRDKSGLCVRSVPARL